MKTNWVWNNRTTVGVKRPGCESTGTRENTSKLSSSQLSPTQDPDPLPDVGGFRGFTTKIPYKTYFCDKEKSTATTAWGDPTKSYNPVKHNDTTNTSENTKQYNQLNQQYKQGLN